MVSISSAEAPDYWNNLELNLNRIPLLTPVEAHRLSILKKKVTNKGNNYRGNWNTLDSEYEYANATCILIRSDFWKCDRFIECGNLAFDISLRYCGERFLCPHCTYFRYRRRLLEEYGLSLSRSNEVVFVTLSLSADPDHRKRIKFNSDRPARDMFPMKPQLKHGVALLTADDSEQSRLLISLFKEAIEKYIYKHPTILGCVAVPEVSVSFNPLLVRPHWHLILWCDTFTCEDLTELRGLMADKISNCRRLEKGIYPIAHSSHLLQEKDLRAVLSYIGKPIDLLWAYREALNRSEDHKYDVNLVNSQTKLFLKTLPKLFSGIKRIYRFKAANSRSKGFLGVTTAFRIKQRARVAEYRSKKIKRGRFQVSIVHKRR